MQKRAYDMRISDWSSDVCSSGLDRRRVSVTSACIGSAVPSTTALRWITILDKNGFWAREADPGDARRVYVKLSARGYSAMLEYFARTEVRSVGNACVSPGRSRW